MIRIRRPKTRSIATRFAVATAVAASLLLVAGAPAAAQQRETAVFAGGCFWGIEAVFEHVKGVTESVSGYAGGNLSDPSYDLVSTGRSGHAESVRVTYDPSKVSYDQLLDVFFAEHDPTTLDRQGPDHGTQYRSAIFFTSEAQGKAAQAAIDRMTAAKRFKNPIVTQVAALARFWPAENYHQDYLEHHPLQPYILINDKPKLADLERRFPALWRE